MNRVRSTETSRRPRHETEQAARKGKEAFSREFHTRRRWRKQFLGSEKASSDPCRLSIIFRPSKSIIFPYALHVFLFVRAVIVPNNSRFVIHHD